MAFKTGKLIVANETADSDTELNEHEIVQLLALIKDSTFKGEQVEAVYNIVLKLQNQYTKKTS